MKQFVYLLISKAFPPATIVLALALAGCGESGPARAPIRGRVTLGGQPLKAGRIIFTPQAPNTGPATSAAISEGVYQLARTEGPIVGRNRVEIEAVPDLGFPIDDDVAFAERGNRPLPRSPIPPQFNEQSQLTTEVLAADENTFDVSIPASRYTVARPQY